MVIAEKPSLLTRYETMRRKEYERLTGLLDALGRVDGLSEEQMDQARDALFHADHPYLITLMGAFNTGKSSLINALMGERVLDVGATPTTSKVAILRHGPALQRSQAGDVETVFFPHPLLERVSLVDTPGLESIFKKHDEVTRKFLHRADIVWMVMLATQAASATNIEYLQSLRAYGKRIIVIINQIDLLDESELPTLRSFVEEQCRLNLGTIPDVWMVSSRLAMDAQKNGMGEARDAELWRKSGFDNIEKFINNALSDAERVRQKLETPLQISRNVLTQALSEVRRQQDALAEHRRSAGNVRGQIDASVREQEATVQAALTEIDTVFTEAIRRGRESIADVFQLSKALPLTLGGITELLGLSRVFRRLGAQTPAANAFAAHKVDEPLTQLNGMAERLAPRLEGRDVKDVDDLVLYTRSEIARLPGSLQNKLVGKLEVPPTYDRTLIRGVRDDLNKVIESARTTEFAKIDSAVRNTIVVLAIYELIALIGGILLLVLASSGGIEGGAVLILFLVVLFLLFAGLAFVPLRGLLMQNAYAQRMRVHKQQFQDALKRGADQQVAFGKQMRQDAVAPFMRLVDAQVSQVDTLKKELDAHETGITALEKELGNLRL
jgi:small GTP-binding protein